VAKTRYSFEKRRKELAKKQKREEKALRRKRPASEQDLEQNDQETGEAQPDNEEE